MVLVWAGLKNKGTGLFNATFSASSPFANTGQPTAPVAPGATGDNGGAPANTGQGTVFS
jgi:hypothetical protein